MLGDPEAGFGRSSDPKYRVIAPPGRPKHVALHSVDLEVTELGIGGVRNETVLAVVYRVLPPHERRVTTVLFHPAVLIRHIHHRVDRQEQALHIVDHLPYPEQLYIEVCGLSTRTLVPPTVRAVRQ